MMLRRLVDEIVRRRLWPIPVLALLVLVAAPLFFLKSTPADAPAASAPAPAAAPAGELPARARHLLTVTDGKGGGGSTRAKQDPFKPPSSSSTAAATRSGGASTSSSSSSGSSGSSAAKPSTGTGVTEPIPVVITNPGGSGSSNGKDTPRTSTAIDGGGDDEPGNGGVLFASVDVRFGDKLPMRLHRRIPRLQTFVAGDRVIAIFVKYSPTRNKAVFAIAPSTIVTGDVDCRRKEGVCRFVDVPAGKHVRLTALTPSGTAISRRLDVVRIDSSPSGGKTIAAASSSAPDDGKCLLGKIMSLTAHDAPLPTDACQSS